MNDRFVPSEREVIQRLMMRQAIADVGPNNPLADIRLEESVLSTMASGKRVESLEEHHFTSSIRKIIYLLMRSGVPYEGLDEYLAKEGLRSELGYVADLFVSPSLPHKPLLEAVAELKRLHLMRRFCEEVDEWRKVAPVLDWSVALQRLGAVIRRQGEAASTELRMGSVPAQNPKSSSGSTPK